MRFQTTTIAIAAESYHQPIRMMMMILWWKIWWWMKPSSSKQQKRFPLLPLQWRATTSSPLEPNTPGGRLLQFGVIFRWWWWGQWWRWTLVQASSRCAFQPPLPLPPSAHSSPTRPAADCQAVVFKVTPKDTTSAICSLWLLPNISCWRNIFKKK